MTNKSIKFNAILNIIRVASGILFPLITFPYVSHVLGPASIGRINFTHSVINYFVLIASLGIPSYAVLECSRKKENILELKKTVCELLYINLLLAAVSYLLFFILLFRVAKFGEYMDLLLLNSLTIFFTVIGIEWLYNALEDFRYITLRSVVFRFASLLLILIFVRSKDDLFIYAVILMFSTLGSNFLNFIHAKKYIKFFPLRELDMKRHLKPIAIFFAASIAGTINGNTDSVMLGFFKDDYALGIYDFGIRIKNLLVSVFTAALSVTTPRFALYAAQHRDREYRSLLHRCTLAVLSLTVCCTVFCIFFSAPIIDFLGGDAYAGARSTMIILALCVIVLSMTWILGVGVLQPLGREKYYARVLYYACGINILVNALLIPRFSAAGAAFATLLTEFFNMCLFYHYAKDYIKDSLSGLHFPRMLIIAVLSGCLSLYVCSFINTNVFFLLLTGGFIFVILYWLLLALAHKELREIIFDTLQMFKRRIAH